MADCKEFIKDVAALAALSEENLNSFYSIALMETNVLPHKSNFLSLSVGFFSPIFVEYIIM